MQIRMVAQNSINMTVGGSVHRKHASAQTAGGVFDGAQCKVTISKEGRKLSEQAQSQAPRSAQSLKAEKIMQRQQEEAAQVGSIRDQYMEQIKEIDKGIKSLGSSVGAGADEVTKEKKQQVLEAMRKQLQTQLEQNRRKQEDAQQMAKQSFDTQDEIDRKNRDLLIMLKSIEESEKAGEEEQESGSSKTESGGSDGVGAKNSVGDVIQNEATQFSVSSMERELSVVDMIDALHEDGQYYLGKADEITRSVLKESESLQELLDDENYSDAEKAEEMSRYWEKSASAYKEVAQYRRRGLQMMKDSKECKIQHIADNPLQGMEETKESMMRSAREAVMNEASKSKLDEASQELQDEVKKLIDERNDITHTASDEKENNEEQKEIGDLFGTEEPELEQE